jgi:hypothetical protein
LLPRTFTRTKTLQGRAAALRLPSMVLYPSVCVRVVCAFVSLYMCVCVCACGVCVSVCNSKLCVHVRTAVRRVLRSHSPRRRQHVTFCTEHCGLNKDMVRQCRHNGHHEKHESHDEDVAGAEPRGDRRQQQPKQKTTDKPAEPAQPVQQSREHEL